MIVYLCGPIDFIKDKKSWKEELRGLCKNDLDMLLFDPDTYTFNNLTQDISIYIHNVNKYALNQADIVVARWMSGQTSVGTPIELYYALQIHKPIILMSDMTDSSVYLKFLVEAENNVVVSDLNGAYGHMLRLNRESNNEDIT